MRAAIVAWQLCGRGGTVQGLGKVSVGKDKRSWNVQKAHDRSEVEDGLSAEPVDDSNGPDDSDQLHDVGDTGVDELLVSCESKGCKQTEAPELDVRLASVNSRKLQRKPYLGE